jgi:hypothetical protein
VRWQAVFRATPLLRSQEKRCRARLPTLLVTALQKDLSIYMFCDFLWILWFQHPKLQLPIRPAFMTKSMKKECARIAGLGKIGVDSA